ncbi:hypothetical protein TorRG33x02_220210, partial [Trema orientale]
APVIGMSFNRNTLPIEVFEGNLSVCSSGLARKQPEGSRSGAAVVGFNLALCRVGERGEQEKEKRRKREKLFDFSKWL